MNRIVLGIVCAASMACSSAGAGRAPAIAHVTASCAGSTVTSDAELQRFRGCREVAGDLLLQNVTSLAPLASLRSVEGTLRLEHTTRLYTLAGLEQLRTVRTLEIHHNQALISAGALRNLYYAEHANITHNPRLSTKYGLLEGIAYPVADVEISRNWGLSAEGVQGPLTAKALAAR